MKKTLMKFAALALAATLTLPVLPTAAQAAGIPMSASIRIGQIGRASCRERV